MELQLTAPSVAEVDTEGALRLPAEMRKSLGILPGSRVALRLEGNRIILQPVNEQLLDSLRGRFAGGPSMSDELQRDRRIENEKW